MYIVKTNVNIELYMNDLPFLVYSEMTLAGTLRVEGLESRMLTSVAWKRRCPVSAVLVVTH